MRLLSLFMSVILFLGPPPPGISTKAADMPSLIEDLTSNPIDPEEIVTVIIEMKGDTTLDVDEFCAEFQKSSMGFSQNGTVAAFRNDLVADQTDLMTQISAMVPDVEFRYHYTNLLNGFAARLEYQYLEQIQSLNTVADIYLTQSYRYDKDWNGKNIPTNPDPRFGGIPTVSANGADLDISIFSDQGSVSQMGLETAWNAGYTGAGKVIAVFDSSLRTTHELFSYMDPAITRTQPGNYKTREALSLTINRNEDSLNLFDEGWGSWFHGRDNTGFSPVVQAQIRQGGFYYNEKIPFAVDYMDGDLNVWNGDTGSHGTHVAGIAAGNPGPADDMERMGLSNAGGVLGSAYDAQLLFFKVFSEQDAFNQESDEAVFAALDDAVTLGANAFNLSMGISNGFTTMHSYAQAGYQKAYNRAAAAGISIAVSAANEGRNTHFGTLVDNNTTLLPNNGSLGFSGSLYAPMTVASAQGTGYSYLSCGASTIATVSGSSMDPTVLTALDYNLTPMGETRPGTYPLIDCGRGTEVDILNATGQADLRGALVGKIALVQKGGISYREKGRLAAAAGAAGMMIANSADSESILTYGIIDPGLPTFGVFSSCTYDRLKAALGRGTVTVSFRSNGSNSLITQSYGDVGPSSFTSWGVSDSLRLKPDIMAPGGNILSAGGAGDRQLAIKSGTSMSSPNLAGALLLIQQYADSHLSLFGVSKGTQEYTDLVNQLAASTAVPMRPYREAGSTVRQNLYFSPRRQGAGMADVSRAVTGKVLLHNNKAYNADTGEAPRTKVELYDQLKDSFQFSFTLKNYNSEPRRFDVRACLQTDAVTKSAGRDVLVSPNSYGQDIDAIEDAVMRVKSVQNASLDSDSANINRYQPNASPAVVTVGAGASAVITIEVTLNTATMQEYDRVYPNGMFLEGFVFFDSSHEDVSIPFMGFRGDFTAAPIFDFATIYDDITAKSTMDADFPLYYTTSLSSLITAAGGATTETILGANQYTDSVWPGYLSRQDEHVNQLRQYFQSLRNVNALSAKDAAFSPNKDGQYDLVYANLALLRNAKAVCVVIEDEEGHVVNRFGPEYEYYQIQPKDQNLTQQVASTYGSKYNRRMAWDGTDRSGQVVKEGQYVYKVIGMTEYEYLRLDPKADLMEALTNSTTAQSIEMEVQVDLTAPEISFTYQDDTTALVKVTDQGSGIQAIAVSYETKSLGGIRRYHGEKSASLTLDLTDYGLDGDFNPDALVIQAADNAFNLSTVSYDAWKELPFVAGYANGTFRPQNNITRAETVAILYNLYGSEPIDLSPLDAFTDIPRDHWAVKALSWAIEKGYVSGDLGLATMRPDDIILRSELCSILGKVDRIYQFTDSREALTDPPAFSDISGHWGYAAIRHLADYGIISGYPNGSFQPDNPIKRSETVTMISKFIGRSTRYTPERSFADVPSDHWAYRYIMNAVNGLKS